MLSFSPRVVQSLSTSQALSNNDYAEKAKELNQKGADEQEGQLDRAIGQAKELQARTPWHREGSDTPPVKRNRSAGAMTKGWSYFVFVCTC